MPIDPLLFPNTRSPDCWYAESRVKVAILRSGIETRLVVTTGMIGHDHLTPKSTPQGLRRFLSNDIPSCLAFRPSSVLRQPFHSSTMRLLSRLDDERKSGAIWYAIFRQSPQVE
jgi:hypothetical protein